jgi:hypothetical protein
MVPHDRVLLYPMAWSLRSVRTGLSSKLPLRRLNGSICSCQPGFQMIADSLEHFELKLQVIAVGSGARGAKRLTKHSPKPSITLSIG